MSLSQGKVAIVTDEPGWHGEQLKTALLKQGINSDFVSLSDCAIYIGNEDNDLLFPDFDDLPLGVFVRGVPGGSLEQVIFRLDILHGLNEQGIPVFNTPRSIEKTVDKPLTSLLLHRAGLPTPKTWICESHKEAMQILLEQTNNGKQLVLKPLFGSQGQNLYRVDSNTGLFHDEKFAGIYYLQEFLQREEGDYQDIRVFVIDGVAMASMRRRSQHWITNRAQGAACEYVELDSHISQLAADACRTLNIDYAGVDLLQDKTGQFYIVEVNSIPAWYGLQSVVEFNIADRLINAFMKRLNSSKQLKLCSN